MPFIAPIVGAIAGAIGAVGSFISGLGIIGKVALGIGLNLAANALMRGKQPKPEPAGVQFNTQYGTDTPRQVACGLVGIAGHDCHVNTYGGDNKYLQWVFQLSDFPSDGLSRVAVNGEWVALDPADPDPEKGWKVTSGEYSGKLWIKFYDGTQTAADPNLVEEANPPDRWTANHIGVGITYVVVSGTYDAEKSLGMPEMFFEFRGARLYDWRKDSTVGGSGPHRWGQYSTYEFTENPAVMDYNYRRGFSWNGDMFCGMQMDPADLPLDKYTLAANICSESVNGEPRYRCSIMLDCMATHRDNIEALMKSCGGTVVNAVDGAWPIVGAAQPVLATITDDDLVVGEPVVFQKFRSMGELANSIAGTHPDPERLWSMVGYDTAISPAAIVVDRRTRDVPMDFPTVRSARQAKYLASIYLKENRLEATGEITLRPRWQTLKAGDWIRWNSARYGDRTFIAVETTLYSLDSRGPRNKRLVLQERSASIYDGVTPPAIVVPYPPGKPVYLHEVENFQLAPVTAGSGDKLMPAILATWNTITDVTVIGVDIRYWPTNDPANIILHPTTPADEENALLTAGVVSSTEFAVQTRLVTSPERPVSWSAPETITTLDQRYTDIYPIDIGQLQNDVKDLLNWLGGNDRTIWDEIERLNQLVSDQSAQNLEDKQDLRLEAGNLSASFTEKITLTVSATQAVAQRVEVLEAKVNDPATGLQATATVLSAVTARVSTAEGNIVANTEAITRLSSQVGDVSADALFRAETYTDWAGGWSSIGLQTRVSTSLSFAQAAVLLQSKSDGTARVALIAPQIVLANDVNGSIAFAPFVFQGNTAYMQNIKVQWADIVNANITWAQIQNAVINNLQVTNAMIANLAVDTLKIAGDAIHVTNNAYAAETVTVQQTGYSDVISLSLTVPASSLNVRIIFACITSNVNLAFLVDGTEITRFNGVSGGAIIPGNISNVQLEYVWLAPTAGAHTFTIRA
ncbi:phage tail protein, partial [Chelativorans sp.]|uniref:phage tail protein n=1 Tax=Chelativorans sp. TaxID=2203393 RepID=UPI0028112E40